MTRPRAGIRDTSATDAVLDAAPRRMRRFVWVVGALSVLGVGLASAIPSVQQWSGSERSVSGERLRFATVERGEFTRDISSQGRVVAAVAPTLYAPEPGRVALKVQGGESVSEGELLAKIASPELASQLEQERATLETLSIEVKRQRLRTRQLQNEAQQTIDLAAVRIRAAERELKRAKESFERQVLSRQDYMAAKDEQATAQLEHEHAIEDAKLEKEALALQQRRRELELERQRLLVTELERRIESLAVHSPVSGMVGNLAVEPNDAVSADQPLMTVVDLSAFQVEIQVPGVYANDLGVGMSTEITIGNRTFAGTLVSVSPEVQDNQVTARMRFDGDLPDGLRQNQRVTARILLDQRDGVLHVKRGPFYDSGAGRVAYVVDDGVARRQPIRTGATSLRGIEIVSGLKAGDKIVISNLEPFQGAERVVITNN